MLATRLFAFVLFLWAILIPFLFLTQLTLQLFEWYTFFRSYVSNTIPQGHLLLRTLLLNLSKFSIPVNSFYINALSYLIPIVKRYESED